MCPKEKLFKGYVQLERDLGEIDRCRTIYRQALRHAPYFSNGAFALDILMRTALFQLSVHPHDARYTLY